MLIDGCSLGKDLDSLGLNPSSFFFFCALFYFVLEDKLLSSNTLLLHKSISFSYLGVPL